MSRLPFDPAKMRKRDDDGDDRPLTVSQLVSLIKRVLADKTPAKIRVVGEVSNLSDRNHWYFSLKDEASVVSCVMWASAVRKTGFTPEHGQEVVATGKLDYYGPQGRLQMYVDKLEPVGQGVLELRLRELCEKLRAAGYFADDRKKPLPEFPRHIAVVTSAKGAAVADVIRTARNRMPSVRITVVDVRVQGASAAPDVARAIASLDARRDALGLDAVVITRGGGSLEDLWAFNERAVADAVYRCGLPIVAAIGHETDTTIAELVADLRCSTPTQAAERLVPDAEAERHRLDQFAARLSGSLRRRSEHARTRLDAMAAHPVFKRPAAAIEIHRERLDAKGRRLAQAMRHAMSEQRNDLAGLRHALAGIEPAGRVRLAAQHVAEARRRLAASMGARVTQDRRRVDALGEVLEAIDPRRVLERGYSYTTDAEGQVIRSSGDVGAGDAIVTHVSDGSIRSTVDEAGGRSKPKKRSKKPARSSSSDAGDTLFG